jgi:hypothetical protein
MGMEECEHVISVAIYEFVRCEKRLAQRYKTFATIRAMPTFRSKKFPQEMQRSLTSAAVAGRFKMDVGRDRAGHRRQHTPEETASTSADSLIIAVVEEGAVVKPRWRAAVQVSGWRNRKS